ncbi:MAG: transcription-repair coupling factor [Firmicutes bacterium]|nr:transcription-repair coupling factor [Bacillota bacterium]
MKNKGMVNIAGASEGRVAALAADIISKGQGQSLIVVPTVIRARRLATDLAFFHGETPIFVMPEEEDVRVAFEARSSEEVLERMKVLKAGLSGQDCVIIAPVRSAIRKLPPAEIFRENTLTFACGQDVDTGRLPEQLSRLGYERVSVIESRGEFTIRGGIIDVFPADSEYPVRIELFDTEVDSIRTFDPQTQRSIDAIDRAEVFACRLLLREEEGFARAGNKIRRAYDRRIRKLEKAAAEKAKKEGGSGQAISASSIRTEQTYQLARRRDQLLEYLDQGINLQYLENFPGYFYEETEYLWDYLQDPLIMIDDPGRILETLEAAEKELAEDVETILSEGRGIGEDFAAVSGSPDYFRLYDKQGYIFTPFVSTIRNAPFLSELRQVNCRQMPAYNGRLDTLKADLDGYLARGFAVTIVCSTQERLQNMQEYLDHEGLHRRKVPDGKGGMMPAPGSIRLVTGTLTAGMEFPDEKRCWIWEGDVFGGSRRTRRPRRSKTAGERIKSFADVQTGDYVVHESHGIGKFVGVEQMVVLGVKQDYLKVKYAGSDMLYIPVDQLGILQKYIGGGGSTPRLNKLTGGEWKKTRARAQAAVEDMAQDLLRVSAARMQRRGHAFQEDTIWQREFEEGFPYTETEDQLKCSEEIKRDMERDIPMDRLLCGDVGYGKTEVAARALFKCVCEGKQAAVLVPTTLLANQHYYTLKDRFEKFPFRVEMLSRFRTAAQQKEIVKNLAEGKIDLVIGTHRLLSSDVSFRDLGLLVVDEEQRFGVRHKEKIKQLKENVDVLTLSATPIPRTLHMSLSGIRDMSTIEEPPEDRQPVQTYVMEQDDFVIREAIEKELARGGQVYVLYNRVDSISRAASDISRLVPEASVGIGHGKMKEQELEDVIMDFAEGAFDVLVSTTIVESGMDIPNVNTMIILDADRFGLAQLYQLRGRVGRSGRLAYAYLMYRRDKSLSEVAEKRLRAIREFTEFGSGFRIAMKDLELRGAGNLLGTEQSGHMLNVGYELYCKLLEEAVARLSGDTLMPQAEETVFSVPVPALIPRYYIEDEILRLQMYKKIAMIRTAEDASDVIDELVDRFGDIPRDTMSLIRISRIRSMAGQLGVREITQNGYRLVLKLWETTRFADGVIPRLAAFYGEKIKFYGGGDPYIRLTVGSPKSDRAVLQEMELFFRTALGEEQVN